jgi:hypothetical protein
MMTNAAVRMSEMVRRFVVCLVRPSMCEWVCVCIKLSVLDVIEPEGEKPRDVVVVERVEDLPARFPRADEVHLAQSTQLMGDGGFGHAESIGDGADASFPVHKLGDDADAACVAQGAEELGEFDGFKFG